LSLALAADQQLAGVLIIGTTSSKRNAGVVRVLSDVHSSKSLFSSTGQRDIPSRLAELREPDNSQPAAGTERDDCDGKSSIAARAWQLSIRNVSCAVAATAMPEALYE